MKKALCAALATTVMLTASGCAVTAPDPIPDTDNRPVLDGTTLVTFGDSITAQSTWPMAVAEELNMNLVNSGIGANTTAHAAARFERDVAAHNPDYVIIAFGSNDFNRMGSIMPQVAVEDYTSNLQSFVDQTKALGATPLLMTPPFISEGASGGASLYPEGSVNAGLDVYVEAMRSVAADNDVILIDIHEVCETQDPAVFLCSDGVHLSPIGDGIYKDTICDVMTEHFRNDPAAPRVEIPTLPAAEAGAWTKNIVPYDINDWLIIYPETVEGETTADGAVSFWNTNSKWPEVHYSPAVKDMITAPVEGTTLTIDMDLAAGTNILLFFGGPTPTHPYDTTYTSLTSALKAANPTIRTSGDDILGSQHIQETLALKDIVPSSCIADNGTVTFSGVKIFVIGTAYLPVTINEMSITTV